MPTRLAVLLFSLVATLPAFADGGTLRFEGAIINPTCAASTCTRDFPAFTTQYLPLNPGETSVDNQVLTITYN
jgi:type 1 fimbria pilin